MKVLVEKSSDINGEFQDPKMEVLYHIRPYFAGIFPYIMAIDDINGELSIAVFEYRRVTRGKWLNWLNWFNDFWMSVLCWLTRWSKRQFTDVVPATRIVGLHCIEPVKHTCHRRPGNLLYIYIVYIYIVYIYIYINLFHTRSIYLDLGDSLKNPSLGQQTE